MSSAARATYERWTSVPIDDDEPDIVGVQTEPASAEALDEFEAQHHVKLPSAFRELYWLSDGTSQMDGCENIFWPISAISSQISSFDIEDPSARWIGSYDLVYSRDYDTTYRTVGQPASGDVMINGRRILQRNVVVASGSNSLAIDIPTATLDATVTMGGAALPASNASSYDDANFYLVALDTTAEHSIGAVMYRYSGGVDTLYAGSTLSARVMPGTYDLLYVRDFDRSSDTIGQPAAADVMINGRRLLGACLNVP